jgi:hypothetical protein
MTARRPSPLRPRFLATRSLLGGAAVLLVIVWTLDVLAPRLSGTPAELQRVRTAVEAARTGTAGAADTLRGIARRVGAARERSAALRRAGEALAAVPSAAAGLQVRRLERRLQGGDARLEAAFDRLRPLGPGLVEVRRRSDRGRAMRDSLVAALRRRAGQSASRCRENARRVAVLAARNERALGAVEEALATTAGPGLGRIDADLAAAAEAVEAAERRRVRIGLRRTAVPFVAGVGLGIVLGRL